MPLHLATPGGKELSEHSTVQCLRQLALSGGRRRRNTQMICWPYILVVGRHGSKESRMRGKGIGRVELAQLASGCEGGEVGS